MEKTRTEVYKLQYIKSYPQANIPNGVKKAVLFI